MSTLTISERIIAVDQAHNKTFSELVEISGLNPAFHFQHRNLRGIEFNDSNLSKFNFTGSDLEGATFHRTIMGDIVLDEYQLKSRVLMVALLRSDYYPDNQPVLPQEPLPITEKKSKNPILSRLSNLFSTDLGICLGTTNTLVYARGKDIVLNEPSVVAYSVKNGTKIIHAVGEDATMMVGRTPANIEAIRPMKDGVIADFEVAEAMIGYFIKKVHPRSRFASPNVVISVPSGATAVEKRAISQSARQAGANNVYLVQEPLAAALGAGLPIHTPVGSMIVDIGKGTTEVAVLSLDGIVYSRSVRVGVNKFDDAIITEIRSKTNLLIGENSAGKIRQEIGSAISTPNSSKLLVTIKGRDQKMGAPREIRVTQKMITECLSGPVDQIFEALKAALEATPPELAADIVSNGITLTGEGALLRNLDKALQHQTGINVYIAEHPITATVRGLGAIVENIRKWKSVIEVDDY